jgi:hypothetical protein
LRLCSQGKKTILSNIYRSPTPTNNVTNATQIELFNSKPDDHLHEIFQLNPDSFIFLDANINLLKVANNQSSTAYMETVHNNGYLQIISKATRIVGDTFSLIDHVLCKNFNQNFLTRTFVVDLSDHFMNCLCIPSLPDSKNSKPQPKYSRNFSLANMIKFREALRNLNWQPVYLETNVNQSFDTFWDSFSLLYDLYFPLTKTKFNKNIHRINDFMTNGLLLSRKRKLDLHKLSITDPTNFLKEYKLYRNTFNSTLRASKVMHYNTKFAQCAKDLKKTWELINELTLNQNSKKSTTIPHLSTPNGNIKCPTLIADEFNTFFSKAGKKIVDDIPHT